MAALSGSGPCVLVAFDHTGQPLVGFPQTVSSASSEAAYPVVGDLDDDGDLEIVAAAASFSDPNAGAAAAYHHDGQPLSGWPKAISASQMSPPVLGDLDGDGSLEVLTGIAESVAGRGALYIWDGAGNPMPNWPVFTPSTLTFTSTPFFPAVILNADGDHRSEVIVPRIHEFFLLDLDPLLTPFGHPLHPSPSPNTWCASSLRARCRPGSAGGEARELRWCEPPSSPHEDSHQPLLTDSAGGLTGGSPAGAQAQERGRTARRPWPHLSFMTLQSSSMASRT